MRIVHIYKDYSPVRGGIENHIKLVAEAQAALGHDVTVLVTQLPGLPHADGASNGVRVVKVPRQLDVQSAPIGAAFPRWVARLTRNADIAHLHAPYPIGEACNLWFGRARRTVITWHSDIVRQKWLLRLYAPILRSVVARADAIMPTSAIYAQTSPWLRGHLDKCHIVPLGIDLTRRHAPPEPSPSLRNRWGCPPDALILLSVGRLRYYKGLDTPIRALPELPDVVLVIVGSGPMEAAWRALAQQLGVGERVIFAGEVSDVELPAYHRAADVYVAPANSRAEAFGIAILEAMAGGLPVISTEVGTATSWVNQHGLTGLVIPPNDPAALIAAVNALRDLETRRRMGRAAQARVQAEFTHTQMIQRIAAVYRSVMGTSGREAADEG